MVTGYVQYITGCNQALVVPPVDKEGKKPDGHWFDEQRLRQVGDEVIRLENGSHPGPDQSPPVR